MIKYTSTYVLKPVIEHLYEQFKELFEKRDLCVFFSGTLKNSLYFLNCR